MICIPKIEVADSKPRGAEIAKKLRQRLRVKRDIELTPVTLFVSANAGDK